MNTGEFDFVVVGAGFSGSVIAERISNVLNKNVLILDRRNHIGGNAYDFESRGITVQKYGPHIFHTKNESVWDYVSRFTDWIPYRHKVRAFVKGKFIPLPFNFESIDMLFPKPKAENYKRALTKEFCAGQRVSIFELAESKNPMVRNLSHFIYENIFLNYTKKQWGVVPDRIDKSVLKRVPVSISYEDAYFEDKHQGIPKKGFLEIFEKMLKNKRIKLMLETDFSDLFSVDLKKRKIFLKNGKEYKGIVFYTGCPDEFFSFEFGELPYRSLEFEFERISVRFFQKTAVVNYPNDFDFTRITEFKHFYGNDANDTIIAKEFPVNMKPGRIPYYPVLNGKSKRIFEKYEFEAKKFGNLFFIGRLANFKYVNMDEAVLNALNLFERIFHKK